MYDFWAPIVAGILLRNMLTSPKIQQFQEAQIHRRWE
jgi:hypothetical protein